MNLHFFMNSKKSDKNIIFLMMLHKKKEWRSFLTGEIPFC